MTYFGDDKSNSYSENTQTESAFERLGEICLEELMFSSDAYVCMIEINMHGFKRLHRHLSRKFHNLYLDLQKETFEHLDKSVFGNNKYKKYITNDIKEHLHTWNKLLKKHLKEIGLIIRTIFEDDGYISCVAKELQYILYRNLIKNERRIKEFDDCEWDYDTIYRYDHHLHKKMKKKEEEYGYKDIHERHK